MDATDTSAVDVTSLLRMHLTQSIPGLYGEWLGEFKRGSDFRPRNFNCQNELHCLSVVDSAAECLENEW